jgi:CheY-like chemotaxis protein
MVGFNDVEILLVEDNPEDAELTLRALKKNNLANNIFHVKDGAEALEFLFATGAYVSRRIESPPRVILLDLNLPKVSGLEVLQKLKSDERTRMVPVVALTSSKQDRDMAESYKLGVNSYIVKPVEFEAFLESVKRSGFYWLMVNKIPR